MSEPFVGEVMLVGFHFAPRGFAVCDGAMQAIGSNSALYSLIGTTYGGDGRSTFALPDLRGRRPISFGTGRGMAQRTWGQHGGDGGIKMTTLEMPPHTHTLKACNHEGNSVLPAGSALSASDTGSFTGEVPSGIPVTGSTTIQGKTGALKDGQTTESREISGLVFSEHYDTGHTPDRALHQETIGVNGRGDALPPSPYLGLLYVIAIHGIYPSRN